VFYHACYDVDLFRENISQMKYMAVFLLQKRLKSSIIILVFYKQLHLMMILVLH